MPRAHIIANWLGLALMGAGAVLLSQSPLRSLEAARPALLVAAVPLAVHLAAAHAGCAPALRVSAMAINWLAALLFGSAAALALTEVASAAAVAPVFGGAAVLYGWNAVSLALDASA